MGPRIGASDWTKKTLASICRIGCPRNRSLITALATTSPPAAKKPMKNLSRMKTSMFGAKKARIVASR